LNGKKRKKTRGTRPGDSAGASPFVVILPVNLTTREDFLFSPAALHLPVKSLNEPEFGLSIARSGLHF
jgi:hypothetical protein